jgi:hypothetical protein
MKVKMKVKMKGMISATLTPSIKYRYLIPIILWVLENGMIIS